MPEEAQHELKQIAEGLAWPEGPALLPDGRVVFVETYRSQVSVLDLHTEGARPEQFCYTGGGPNATTVGSDGSVYVTQNGGVVGPWRAPDRRPASIQRIEPGGGAIASIVTEVAGIELQAPNDLSFGADGRLYFTDPGRFDPDTKPDPGRVFAVDPSGAGELVVDDEPTYPNGIVAEASGSIVWTESYTRRVRRRHPNGTIDELCQLPEGHLPDGLAAAANGDLYVTTTTSGGVDVIGADGSYKGFVAVGAVPTNCAFVGTALLVADGGTTGTSEDSDAGGRLWLVGLGVAGMAVLGGRIG